MLRALRVEIFGPFGCVEVAGLDRVNLLVGGAEATTLLAALAFAEGPGLLGWAHLGALPGVAVDDVERAWRPLFHGPGPARLTRTDAAGRVSTVTITLSEGRRRGGRAEVTWRTGAEAHVEGIPCGRVRIRHDAPDPDVGAFWSAAPPRGEGRAGLLGRYTPGRAERLGVAVRLVCPGARTVEVVRGGVVVGVEGGPFPLEALLGEEAARRLVELAMPLSDGDERLYVDAIDASFGGDALSGVWELLRRADNGQVFVTAASDAAVRAACACFLGAGDDTSRVLRLEGVGEGARVVGTDARTAVASLRSGNVGA